MAQTDDTKAVPPYGSFSTFWNYVLGLANKPLPTHLDRSMMTGKSGTDQATIISALKFFELIDTTQGNKVEDSLIDLVQATGDARKQFLARLVRQSYSGQLAVSDLPGTEAQLHKSFEDEFGVTGETRRKASTFFLHAAREAGIEVSPHFPKPRSGQGRAAPGKKAAKKKAGGKSATRGPTKTTDAEGGDTYTLGLDSGTEVQLTVRADLMSLMRHDGDRKFVMELVDKLDSYGSSEEDEDYEFDEVEVTDEEVDA